MGNLEHKNFSAPDEVREFSNGNVDNLHLDSGTVGRFVLRPGWKWSNDVKPVAGTDWCEVAHFSYQVSGTLHLVMKDGSHHEAGPGAVTYVPPGHDAWVVGDEPVVLVDWTGTTEQYAKPQ